MYQHKEVWNAIIEACIFTDESDWEANEGLAESTKRCLSKLAQDFIDFLGTSRLTCVRTDYTVSDQLGYDLWLTCNGHGAGFWDGDWEGECLPKAIKWCQGKNMETYVGDDGYVYILGHEES